MGVPWGRFPEDAVQNGGHVSSEGLEVVETS